MTISFLKTNVLCHCSSITLLQDATLQHKETLRQTDSAGKVFVTNLLHHLEKQQDNFSSLGSVCDLHSMT